MKHYCAGAWYMLYSNRTQSSAAKFLFWQRLPLWLGATRYTIQHSTVHKDLNRISITITESDYDIYSKQINFAEDSLFSYIRSQKVKKRLLLLNFCAMTANVSRTSLLWYSLYYFTDTLGYNPSALLIKALNESLCLTLVFSLLWPHKGSLKGPAIYPSFYHLLTNEIPIKLNHNLWSALNKNKLEIKAEIKKKTRKPLGRTHKGLHDLWSSL